MQMTWQMVKLCRQMRLHGKTGGAESYIMLLHTLCTGRYVGTLKLN